MDIHQSVLGCILSPRTAVKCDFPEDFLEISHSSKMWTDTEACLTSVTKNVDTEVACMSTRVVDGPLRLHSNVQGPFLEVFLEIS